jgi:hypothetical protein
MHKNSFDCKPEFQSSRNSKSCEKFYKLAASMQSAQNFCKEYIAAWIWPLKKGWGFVRFHEKVVRGKTYIFPDNEVFCPKKYTEDKEFVSAIETKVVEILGKFLKKEKDLMDKILGSDYKRLNRVFDIAQIEYGERSAPAYARSAKPSIDNVTRKKRGGAPLTKKVSKKKAKTARFSDSDVSENFVDEAFKKISCDDEVRMFSLVFDSSGLMKGLDGLRGVNRLFKNLYKDKLNKFINITNNEMQVLLSLWGVCKPPNQFTILVNLHSTTQVKPHNLATTKAN